MARALVLLTLILVSGSAAAGERPHRVSSLNLCTDELIMALADPADIASLSPLARDRGASVIADQAQAIQDNHASSEEILREHADLVLAETGVAAETVAILRRLGVRVETVPLVDRLDQVAPTVLRVAALLGQVDRGAALVDAMQARLRALPPAARRTALIYESNGWSAGPGTMRDDILTAAGLTNQAGIVGLHGYGKLPLEQVVAQPPDILVTEHYQPGEASLAEEWLDHPALRRLRAKIVSVPSALMICGTPRIVDAVSTLAQATAPAP